MNEANDQTETRQRTPIATRAPAPRPKRLSRKAIVALAATGLVGMAAALTYSLGKPSTVQPMSETVSVERGKARLIEDGPKDYADLARQAAGDIGPPPPAGDLATPIPDPIQTTAEQAGYQDRQDQKAQQAQLQRQQAESARTSRLFAGSSERQPRSPPSTPSSTTTDEDGPERGTAQTRNAPEAKRSILTGTTEPTTNSGRIQPARTNTISAGSTIPAALITGLSSDLPGQVIAQVTEDVFDSTTGRAKLIPQGARLLGSYDEDVGYGQTRALVVWTRLIFPDGRSMDLDRLIGADAQGQSGLTGKVDHHWGAMLKAGVLSTLLGLGAAVTELGENGEIANAIRDSAGQTIGRAGDRIVEKQLGVKPTVTVKPGTRVRVLVSRDLVFEPVTATD